MDMIMVTVCGRLGRDAEIKTYGNEGKQLVSLAIAAGYGFGDNKGTIWFKGASFAKFDLTLAQNGSLLKGSKVTVVGELKEEHWTDSSGAAKSALSIDIKKIIPEDRQQGGQQQSYQQPQGQQQYQQPPQGQQQPPNNNQAPKEWGKDPNGSYRPAPNNHQPAQPAQNGGWGGSNSDDDIPF